MGFDQEKWGFDWDLNCFAISGNMMRIIKRGDGKSQNFTWRARKIIEPNGGSVGHFQPRDRKK